MPLIEAFRSALSAIGANALRSLLTMLGIVIGVAAVIAMVGIGAGARDLVDRQIRRRGRTSPSSRPATSPRAARGSGPGRPRRSPTRTPPRSGARSTASSRRAPFVRGTAQAVFAASNWATSVYAVDLDYFVAREWEVATGRAFEPDEVRRGEIVALLGRTVARNLFGDADPLDPVIRVAQRPVQGGGHMASKGQRRSGRTRTT